MSRIFEKKVLGKEVVRYVTQEKFKTMGFYDTEHVIIVFIVSFERYVIQGLNCVKKHNENVHTIVSYPIIFPHMPMHCL